mgnify:CR=1 FL=1
MLTYKTEDEVRDEARILLNLTNNENKTKSGVGQLTSFSSLDNYYLKDNYGFALLCFALLCFA